MIVPADGSHSFQLRFALPALLEDWLLRDSKEKARQRQTELEGVTVQLDTAHKQLKLLRGDKERLGREHRTTVEQPATRLTQLIQTLADHSVAATQLTGLPAVQDPSDTPVHRRGRKVGT